MPQIVLPELPKYKLEKLTHRGRGRPRKVGLPAKDKVVEVIQKKREKMLESDELTNILKEDPDSLDVLDQIMIDMAEEAAALKFERTEAERNGVETTTISSRKVTALKTTAEIFLRKRDALVEQSFDFKSKRFQRFMEWIFKVYREAAITSGLRAEQISILFDHLAKIFEDERWQQEAMDYIKSES